MKKCILLITLVSSILVACYSPNSETDSSLESLSSSFSRPSEDKSSMQDSYSENINNFLNYREWITDYSTIYYWKNENGFYRCGLFAPSSDVYKYYSSFQNMQSEMPCPLPIMAEIIKEKCDQKQIKLIEIDYPISEECYLELFAIPISRYTSNNIEVYKELNILDTYHSYFGDNSDYFDLSKDLKDDDSKAVKTYYKYFYESSYIFAWQVEEDYSFGISYWKKDECISHSWITFVQDLPCTKDDIRRLVELYYNRYSYKKQNLIVQIPVIKSYQDYRENILANYPDNINYLDDKSLYEDLGLLDSYSAFFNKD